MGTATRLSPLDDSFLALESPAAHMHVGWTALFEPPADRPRPSFEELRRHISMRLRRAPRYRQKISPAPLDMDAPSWIDDPHFDISHHVRRAASDDLDQAVEHCMSRQLSRHHPLWEVHIAEQLGDGRIAVIGKAHHCMVDGIAAVELASLLLDPTADARAGEEGGWRADPAPGALARVAVGLREKAMSPVRLARGGAGLLLSPRRLFSVAGDAPAALRAAGRTLHPATPVEPLNQPLSAQRRVARVERPLRDLKQVQASFGTKLNDVYLAASAGALRQVLIEHGRRPVPLKTMVPVNVRGEDEDEAFGNRISFMFIELPCEEPDPELRLRRIHAESTDAKESDPGLSEATLKLAASAPRAVQRLVSRVMASPRMFNLVVSNIPGPSKPMYMAGCELKEAYPVVPLAQGHTLSIGMTTVRDRACFGLYADAKGLADVAKVGVALERSTDELVQASRR
jgi:diacylglycerol O-acyltransferase / wax synthase